MKKGKGKAKEKDGEVKGKHKDKGGDGDKKEPGTKKKGSKTHQHEPPAVTEKGGAGDAEAEGTPPKREEDEQEAKEQTPPKPAPPEWDSEFVRNHNLFGDGFKCCMVMVMEDSPELSKYSEYLGRAIETGVRKRFSVITGSQVAERAKQFLVSTGQRDIAAEDHSYFDRQDIFAEAIKYTMIAIKESVHHEMEADYITKEMELSGARSKEYIRLAPPVTLTSALDDASEERVVPPPPPPTSVTPAAVEKKGLKRKSQSFDEGDKSQRGSKDERLTNQSSEKQSGGAIGIKTRMRKRGEMPRTELEVIDDTPPKGPQSFILLQGFYNPRVIEELREIGVKIEGILLLTDENVNRYNFSIIDVEDSIPFTFRPKIVLPKYLKLFEKMKDDPESLSSPLARFWITLTEMYNSAPIDSYFHDIALLNVKMPDVKPGTLDSADGLTYFIARVFDDVSKRIYEMLVFEEWHQEFTSVADVNQLQPLEPTLPRDVYDKIIGQIPSECISISIIVEALVQQVSSSLDKEAGLEVPEPCYDDDVTQGLVMGKANFGQTNWGVVADPEVEKKRENETQSIPSLFMVPMYIKAGDYASIRSCHLNESLASKIASCQLAGDMRNMEGYLWHNIPNFNRGLHMKLLGNLNHFMYFMPPDLIEFEDMFYVLHLLMSAGVEVQLQKAAEKWREEKAAAAAAAAAEAEAEFLRGSEMNFSNVELRSDGEESKFPGTNLSTEHNYFAINLQSGLNFVITPDTSNTMTVAAIGHSQNDKDESMKVDVDQYLVEIGAQGQESGTVEEGSHKKKGKFKKTKSKKEKEPVDAIKVGRMTTVGAMETAAELAQTLEEYTKNQEAVAAAGKKKKSKKKGKKMEENTPPDLTDGTAPGTANQEQKQETSLTPGAAEPRKSGWGGAQTDPKKSGGDKSNVPADVAHAQEVLKRLTITKFGHDDQAPTTPTNEAGNETVTPSETTTKHKKPRKSGFGNANPSKGKKKFIACEEEWFEDINEPSVIQTLLECPALLAISESGALDLSTWIEKYLFSVGAEIGEPMHDGVLLGELKHWNFVEELAPIQTVQMLNEAAHEYLSMHRMYCPFYDTLLFIFNNPTPSQMKAESNFYCRLKTLPGLQHFLEYTMEDKNVIKWIEQLDSTRLLDQGDAFSIQTMLRIIPEEQWLLVPSIKYQIMIENATHSPFRSQAYSMSMGSYHTAEDLESMRLAESTSASAKSAGGKSRNSHNTNPAMVADHEEIAETGSAEQDVEPSKIPSGETVSGKGKRGSKGSSYQASSKKKSDQGSDKLSQKAAHLSELLEGASDGRSRKSEKETAPRGSGRSDSGMPLLGHANLNLNFTCYDLGKRVVVVGNDTFYLFPMDGTIIRYDISTIEPDFRMMQLSVSKNGHQAFFYPYYIPRDFDLSGEDYVLCPYFHMIVGNGTIFAFQDTRAEVAAPYKINKKDETGDQLFTFDKILFGKEIEKKLQDAGSNWDKLSAEYEEEEMMGRMASPESQASAETAAKSQASKKSAKSSKKKQQQEATESGPDQPAAAEPPVEEKKGKKGVKEKKSKKLHPEKAEKSPDVRETSEGDGKKKKKKDKDKGRAKSKSAPKEVEAEPETPAAAAAGTTSSPPGSVMEEERESNEGDINGETEIGIEGVSPVSNPIQLDLPPPLDDQASHGEWLYPSSESSDEDEAQTKRRLFFAPPWDDAAVIIQPMTHIFKVTLPSGLLIQVDDLPGPPLQRVIKQSYVGHGSARSQIESSRYYTMDGSALKFLFNGNIQILTARGVTTNIDELATNAARDTENAPNAFALASIVKIFNGEVFLPNGQQWAVVNGRKINKNPMYVFTSGPLSGGEVFRRRQDGMICLYRFDGTVITHYPDGTRFTTRMVICENYDEEEFDDWVFVGLKYMIEHPNYSTVLFNTLSGNLHLKLPHGDWVRIFADGSIRVSTPDDYKLDVDKDRAVLTHPTCIKGPNALPNITAVRLWHYAVPAATPEPEQEPQGEVDVDQLDGNKEPGEIIEETPKPEEKEKKPRSRSPSPEPEADKPKKERSRRSVQNTKSLHPKIKQKVAKKGARSTRMSQSKIEQEKRPSPPPTPPDLVDGKQTDLNANTETVIVDEPEPVPVPSTEQQAPPVQVLQEPHPIKRKSEREVGDGESEDLLKEFLTFTDETTICKSVDSWDNRFLINLYGVSLVDKAELKKERKSASDRLLAQLSEYSNLPEKFLSGILKNTSSTNLDTVAKRFLTLKSNYDDTCGNNLSSTKIFVVKRDLSGFQYLKKAQIDDAVTKAYGSKESMVIVDPVPQKKPRKFVTIMRPVDEVDEPHGMWTRPYIEPMFRPGSVSNKHLTVANPMDLRWFGYALNSAHKKRPRFVPDPKEEYLEKKRKKKAELLQELSTEMEEVSEEMQEPRKTLSQTVPPEQSLEYEEEEEDSGEIKSGDGEEEEGYNAEEEFSAEDEEGEEEEESFESKLSFGSEEMAFKSPERVETLMSVEDENPKKKKKKEKKEKKEKEREKEKEKEKKEKKEKKGKGKGATATAAAATSPMSTSEEEDAAVGEVEVDAVTSANVNSSDKSQKLPNRFMNMEPEVGDYPEVDDILGIYEGEVKRKAQVPRVMVKPHNLPCSRKRALVVRAFLEIPKVDENVQRALLAASMSYADTCKSEAALYATYRTDDPRTPQEKISQEVYKQQLIEQNIEQMHLLEQKPGPVLRFNF